MILLPIESHQIYIETIIRVFVDILGVGSRIEHYFFRNTANIHLEIQNFRSSLKNQWNCCRPIDGVTISGTSLYHLVPNHLWATWPRTEHSHLLPEACSPNGTDNRRHRQKRTKHPPPKPGDILKRFYALYDNKWRNFMKKVSKLNYLFNPLMHSVPLM